MRQKKNMQKNTKQIVIGNAVGDSDIIRMAEENMQKRHIATFAQYVRTLIPEDNIRLFGE